MSTLTTPHPTPHDTSRTSATSVTSTSGSPLFLWWRSITGAGGDKPAEDQQRDLEKVASKLRTTPSRAARSESRVSSKFAPQGENLGGSSPQRLSNAASRASADGSGSNSVWRSRYNQWRVADANHKVGEDTREQLETIQQRGEDSGKNMMQAFAKHHAEERTLRGSGQRKRAQVQARNAKAATEARQRQEGYANARRRSTAAVAAWARERKAHDDAHRTQQKEDQTLGPLIFAAASRLV